ncbi:GNAT family N-acetyltransferase [Aneurinibacillus uraniidurans]|uniref:GNAT family N-acetyltransferase n=1 Tax=Aneurinibacillus uraniidurans TaxID=2966586 RepID=UPI0023494136|nr:GNAT family N-acetyltransferase [Aneurinibacillus sp. B1]WCN36437.1 GNAT family N-acetyltransferase [Aneurinibacillus sp. B1]
MNSNIRLATLKDAERLLTLTLAAYGPALDMGILFPTAQADLEMVQNNIKKHDCFVWEEEGIIIATITVGVFDEMKDVTDLPYIRWFAVDPAYAGKGIGNQLITWAEEVFVRDTLQAPAVTLATAEKHPWLIPMYERKGYERFYEYDNNVLGKVVFLRKVVNPTLYNKEALR